MHTAIMFHMTDVQSLTARAKLPIYNEDTQTTFQLSKRHTTYSTFRYCVFAGTYVFTRRKKLLSELKMRKVIYHLMQPSCEQPPVRNSTVQDPTSNVFNRERFQGYQTPDLRYALQVCVLTFPCTLHRAIMHHGASQTTASQCLQEWVLEAGRKPSPVTGTLLKEIAGVVTSGGLEARSNEGWKQPLS